MERNQIEAFITIAEVKKFSRAAELLHLSQPAISRRIQLLEQALGATLFERTKKGVNLTQAGDQFLPYAQRIMATMRDSVEAVQAIQNESKGVVKLAIVGTLASTSLTKQLKLFRQMNPAVQLILQTARSKNVSRLVQKGDVHIGLRYFSDPHPDLSSELILEEELVLACSTQHQFSVKPQTVADLKGIPWVSYPIGSGSSGEPFAKLLNQILLSNELEEPEIIAIDSLTAQKRLIEADFGIGLLPKSSILEELQLETINILNVPIMNSVAPVMMLSRKDGYFSLATKSLMDALRN